MPFLTRPVQTKRRAFLLVAILLLSGLAGSLTSHPARADCVTQATVGDAQALYDALEEFNSVNVEDCQYTITFGNNIDSDLELPSIDNDTPGVTLTIKGEGNALQIFEDSSAFYIFESIVDIQDLTIINYNGGNLIIYSADGQVSQVTLDNVTSKGAGGYENLVIDGGSQVEIRNSQVLSSFYGIQVGGGSEVLIDRTTIGDHNVGMEIINSTVTILNSAIIDHTNVGAIVWSGTLQIINSTLSRNDRAIEVYDANLSLTHATVSGNDIGIEAELDFYSEDSGNIRIANSILAGNSDADCTYVENNPDAAYVFYITHTLFEHGAENACGAPPADGNLIGQPAPLLPLGNYGGPTPTMPPYELTGELAFVNPVIDAADENDSEDHEGDTLQFDQRGTGHDRVINDVPDMGAVEGAFIYICEEPFSGDVEDEGELATAILCFNHTTDPGTYTITLDGDIDLEHSGVPIDNPIEGIDLIIEGGGNTLDAQGIVGQRPLTVAPETDVVVNQLTITGGSLIGPDGGGVLNEGHLTLNQVTVSGNQTSEDGGGIFNEDGAVLILTDSKVNDNQAAMGGGDGGGIANDGHATITRSEIAYNTATDTESVYGGGITTEGVMTIVDSFIHNNEAIAEEGFAQGGGVYNTANLVIRNSTISHNSAKVEDGDYAAGGGIYSDNDIFETVVTGYGSRLFIANSTISGNVVSAKQDLFGGGLYSTDTDGDCCYPEPQETTLINVTLTGNELMSIGGTAEVTDGAGAFFYFSMVEEADEEGLEFNITIDNSILAGNLIDGTPAEDCYTHEADVVSRHSLYTDSGEGACGLDETGPTADGDGNLVGVDPQLQPLGDNGGPTPTHALLDGSPAINAGDQTLALDEGGDPLGSDQRGHPYLRVYDGEADMGAYEAQPEPVPDTDPCPPVDGNVITNFCFEDGSAPWTFHSDGHGVYNVSPFEPYAGLGAAEIKITVPGSNVQFYQSGISLQGDTEYELTFAAKSKDGRDLSVFVHKHGANYASYGLSNHVFNLTDEWAEYTVTFKTPVFSGGSVNDARLRFWLAPFDAAGAVYAIDRVVLRPAGGDPLPEPPPPPDPEVPPQGECTATPGNLIANPGYEDGTSGWLFFTNGSANFTAPETAGGAYECTHNARVKINTSGNNVQLFQTGIELEPNTHYRLRLAAKATGANAVQLFVQRHSAPHSNYGLNGLKLDLTSDWQVFVVDFTTSGFASTTTDTRLRFWLAPYDTAGAVFEFDDVVLTPVDDTPVRATDGVATRGGTAKATTADAHFISGYFIDNNHTDRLGGGYVGVLDGCRNARASQSRLWPANNKLWPVSIGNIGTPQSVAITGVWQDEPVGFEPDAVIGTGGALHLRAERDSDAGADGRVYTIQFRATYADGQSCNGIVTVGVPLSNRRGVEARSGGELFTSTDK